MRVFFSTGEVSGDIAAARLLTALRRLVPDVAATGVGGTRLEAAGAILSAQTLTLGAVGVVESLGAVPDAVRTFRTVRRHLRDSPPDLAVLVGNDLFNMLLARWLRGQGIRTVSYFPPQPWIWRSLAGPIARSYDVILACFPIEQTVYAACGGPTTVTYVGHYLADDLTPVSDHARIEAKRRHGFDASTTVVGLLPGSRVQELQRLASRLIDTAAHLHGDDPALRFVLPVAVADQREFVGREITRAGLDRVVRVTDDSHDAMRASDVLALASGTASLEAALLEVPMVLVYRVAPLTHVVIRALLRAGLLDSYAFGLPNLVLGRPVVPELGQRQATAERIARQVRRLLDDAPGRALMRRELAAVRRLLSTGDSVGIAASTLVKIEGWTGAMRVPGAERRASSAPRPADVLPPEPGLGRPEAS